MTITNKPLSEDEKKTLKKAFKIRFILAVFFLLPLFCLLLITSNITIQQFVNSDYDGMSFFVLGLIIIVVFLVFKYVIPFYMKAYKNTKEINKLVIATHVINLEKKITPKGIRHIITTEYRTIDQWTTSILDHQTPFYFSDAYVGMSLEIHCLENNKTDILRIKKT
jgi:hypothetical protein